MQPVLNAGSVTLISSSLSSELVTNMINECNIASVDNLSDAITLSFKITCPIFVQLAMSKFGMYFFPYKKQSIEVYLPEITDISCNRDTANAIKHSMEQTIEALKLNTKGFILDGCNEFIAQTQLPISMYNTFIVVGTLSQWLQFINSKSRSTTPIDQYKIIIGDMISPEWNAIIQQVDSNEEKE